jgi:hypothetical protein
MNDTRFDDWTRRRFGLVAGGGLVALLVAGHLDEVAARKRQRKRKRRRQPKPTCAGAGNSCAESDPDCCAGLECGFITPGSDEATCCRPDGAPCTPETACCSTNCDAETETCATCRGRPCDAGRPCCALLECEDGFCGGCAAPGRPCVFPTHPCCPGSGDCANGFCGGCVRRVDLNSVPTCSVGGVPCCDTDCTGLCLSEQGGPCAVDQDCRACDFDPAQCAGACHPDTKTCTV